MLRCTPSACNYVHKCKSSGHNISTRTARQGVYMWCCNRDHHVIGQSRGWLCTGYQSSAYVLLATITIFTGRTHWCVKFYQVLQYYWESTHQTESIATLLKQSIKKRRRKLNTRKVPGSIHIDHTCTIAQYYTHGFPDYYVCKPRRSLGDSMMDQMQASLTGVNA